MSTTTAARVVTSGLTKDGEWHRTITYSNGKRIAFETRLRERACVLYYTWCGMTWSFWSYPGGQTYTWYHVKNRLVELPDLCLERAWIVSRSNLRYREQQHFDGGVMTYRRKQAGIVIDRDFGYGRSAIDFKFHLVVLKDGVKVTDHHERIAIMVKELRLSKWRKEARRLLRECRARKLAKHIPITGVVDLVLNYV